MPQGSWQPPAAPPGMQYQVPVSQPVSGMTGARSNVTAGLWAIFLGGIGAHKFYNGSWGWGIIYIVSLFIIPFVSAFVSLIEGIIYLTNVPKYDAEYNQTPPNPWKW